MTTALLLKLAIPFLSSAAVGIIKSLIKQYGGQIPSWLKPLLAALAGAVVGGLGGDPSAVMDSALEGAALGGGAPAVREVYRAIVPDCTTPQNVG